MRKPRNGLLRSKYALTARKNRKKRKAFLERLESRSLLAANIAPQIELVEINGGDTHRSHLTEISVVFDSEVSISGGDAFVVANMNTAEFATDVTSSSVVDGKTVVSLTFQPGPSVQDRGTSPASLTDGIYQLRINSSLVTADGIALDGNGDGVGGDDFIYGTKSQHQLFRLFGDSDGDGIVSLFDFAAFRSTYGYVSSHPNFNPVFDYEGNGVVNLFDYAQFQPNYGTSASSPEDAPTSVDDAYGTHGNQITIASSDGVLTNDSHPLGLALSVLSNTPPANGTLQPGTVATDGSFSYTPNSGFEGDDEFYVWVTDGTLHTPAKVSVKTDFELIAYFDYNDASSADSARSTYNNATADFVGAEHSHNTGGRSGKVGDYALNTRSGYSVINDASFLNTGLTNGLTISYWQQIDSLGDAVTVFGEAPSGDSGIGLAIRAPYGDNRLYFDTAGFQNPGQSLSLDSPVDLPGQWRHFAFVQDGSDKSIWIDGHLVASDTTAALLPTDFTALFVGGHLGAGGDGYIDDFAIFGVPLSANAIAKLASGIAPDKLDEHELAVEGDFDGDGRIESLSYKASTLDVVSSDGVRVLSLAAAAETWRAADFNGDGRDDLAYRDPTGQWTIAISDTTSFVPYSTSLSPDWHDEEVLVGDFDGDGREELIGRKDSITNDGSVDDSRWRVLGLGATGTPQLLTAGLSHEHQSNAFRGNLFVVDVNRDGRDDLVASTNPSLANDTSPSQDNAAAPAWHVSTSHIDSSSGNLTFDTVDSDWGDWFDGFYSESLGQEPVDGDGPYQATTNAFLDVYNNVEMQLYPGFMKGPQATEETQRGNPWDQSALLVNKLAEIGIEAEIVTGDVQFGDDELQDWLGTREHHAARLLLFNALSGSGVTNLGNGITEITHAWVRAKVPTDEGLQWIDIDPSFKLKNRQSGIELTLTGPNGEFDEFDYIATSDQLPIEYFEDRLAEELHSSGMSASISQIPYDGPIIQKRLADQPIHTDGRYANATGITILGSFSDVVANPTLALNHTHRVRLVANTWSHDVIVPDAALDAMTVFVDANNQLTFTVDGNTVGSSVQLPAGTNTLQIHRARPGVSVPIGNPLQFQINDVDFGRHYHVSIDADQYSNDALIRRREAIISAGDTPTIADIEYVTQYVSSKYWYDQRRFARHAQALMHHVPYDRDVQAGLVLADDILLSGDFSHLQSPIVPRNLGVDLPGGSFGSIDIRLDESSTDLGNEELFQLTGYNASALESGVIEETINTESVSTIRGLRDAYIGDPAITGADLNSVWVIDSIDEPGGRTVYVRGELGERASEGPNHYPFQANRTNLVATSSADLKSLLPNQDPAILDEVWIKLTTNVVDTATAVIPEAHSYAGDDTSYWEGGVYVLDKSLSASVSVAQYAIQQLGGTTMNGGFSGNAVAQTLDTIKAAATHFVNYVGDPVNVLNGNMFRDDVDVVMPNKGVALNFARHYDSQSEFDVGLGVGWTHSFGDRLMQDPTKPDEMIWFTSAGVRHTFTKVGNQWQTPVELFGVLTETSGNFVYRSDTGLEHHFNGNVTAVAADTELDYVARLSSVVDRDGHGVQLDYHWFRQFELEAVHDIATTSRALRFDYDSTTTIHEVEKVVDGIVEATWTYQYDPAGTRLTSATNPEFDKVEYEYHAAGPSTGLMSRIIEADDTYHDYEYYANKRAFRVTEGVVEGQSFVPKSSHSFNYNLFTNTTEFTDENGNVTTYVHEESGRLLRHVHDDRSRVITHWGVEDGSGGIVDGTEYLMRDRSDEVGATEVFEYYNTQDFKNRRLYRATDPLGTVTEFNYVQATDIGSEHIVSQSSIHRDVGTANERSTSMQYDGAGRLTSLTDGEDNVTTFTYHSSGVNVGMLASETSARGHFDSTDTEENEAVVWRVLRDETQPTEEQRSRFQVTGDSLTIRLESVAGEGAVVADAIRIERIDQDGLGQLIRISDDNFSGPTGTFAMYTTGGDTGPVSGTGLNQYHGDAIKLTSLLVGQQNHATWSFSNLVPGFYRIATTWTTVAGADSTAAYRIYDGPDTSGSYVESVVDQTVDPSAGDHYNAFTKTFTYDAAGNVTELRQGVSTVSDSGLLIQTSQYHHTGAPELLTDGTGRSVASSYDDVGRLTKSVNLGDPLTTDDDLVSEFEYDRRGRIIQSIDPLGRGTTIEYDYRGNIVSRVDASGSKWVTTYDAKGNPVSTTDPIGRVTELVYDNRDRVIQTNLADGSTNHTSYDGLGRVVSTVDELQRKSEVTYNPRGQVTAALAAKDSSVETQVANKYDHFGDLIESIDARGNVTQYFHDDLGRIVKTMVLAAADAANADPSTSARTTANQRPIYVETTGFDSAGNAVVRIVYDTLLADDRIATSDLLADDLHQRVETGLTAVNGTLGKNVVQSIHFTFDSLGRLSQTIHADGTQRLVEYDAAGRVRFEENERGARSENVFDAFGRLNQSILPDPDGSLSQLSPIVTHEFDAAGNRVAMTDANGHVQQTVYDALDRPVQITDAVGNRSEWVYDTAGQLVASVNALGHAIASQYDSRGRVVRQSGAHPDGTSATAPPVSLSSYDDAGNLVSSVDPLGYETTFVYDELNRLVEERAQRSALVNGVVTTLAPSDDAVTRFGYDGNGNLTTTEVALGDFPGYITTTDYDELNRLVQQTLPDPDDVAGSSSNPLASLVIDYQIDGYGNVRETSESAPGVPTRVDRFEYDSRNRLTAETLNSTALSLDNDFVRNEWQYDAVGNRVASFSAVNSSDPNVNVVNRYEYDLLNRMTVQRMDAPNQSDLGRHRTEFFYDAAGNLIDETFTITSYTGTGEASVTTSYAYDDANRPIGVTSDSGGIDATATTGYDRVGNVVKRVDATGIATTFEYDALNRQVKVVHPDPTPTDGLVSDLVEHFRYDASGNLVSHTNGEGNQTDYLHDSFGNIVSQTTVMPTASDLETVFAFDERGNMTALTDPNGNQTTFVYDNLNRVTKEIQGTTETGTNTRTYQFDNRGNLDSMTDRNGRVTDYDYDGLDRKTSETFLNGSTAEQTLAWEYDKLGRLTRSYFLDDAYSQQQVYTDTFEYDALGRLVQQLNSDDASGASRGNPQLLQTYQHDDLTNYSGTGLNAYQYKQTFEPINQSIPDDNITYVDAVIEFDSLGRQILINEAAAQGQGEKSVAFGYDDAGRTTSITRHADTDNDPQTGTNGFDFYFGSQFAYDPSGRLEQIAHRRDSESASPFATYDYLYDNASRITQVDSTSSWPTLDVSRTEVAGFDDAGRLASWDYDLVDNHVSATDLSASVDRVFELDSAGNRDRVLDNGVEVANQVVGDFNRITTDGGSGPAYTYDNEGNLTGRDNGPGDYVEYVWDHRNRLVEVRQKPSAVGSATDRVRLTYSNGNLLVRKIVETQNGGGDWDISDVEHYVYQGDQLVAVLQGNWTDQTGADDTTTTDGSYKRRVLSGPATDTPIYEQEYVDPLIHGGTQSGPYWTATDHNGSVRDVLIGADELLVQHLEYDAFGDITGVFDDTESSVALDALAVDAAFAGRSWDSDVGLYNNRARWYDGGQGRFISEDPIGHAGGVNLYSYAAGDPVNFRDPSGLVLSGHPLVALGSSIGTAVNSTASSVVGSLAGYYANSQPTPSGWESVSNFAQGVGSAIGNISVGNLGAVSSQLSSAVGGFTSAASSIVQTQYAANRLHYGERYGLQHLRADQAMGFLDNKYTPQQIRALDMMFTYEAAGQRSDYLYATGGSDALSISERMALRELQGDLWNQFRAEGLDNLPINLGPLHGADAFGFESETGGIITRLRSLRSIPVGLEDAGITSIQPEFYAAGLGAGLFRAAATAGLRGVAGELAAESINAVAGAPVSLLGSGRSLLRAPSPTATVRHATPEAYAGVRQASQQLRDAGVPRHIRKQVLESFDRKAMQVRVAGDAEYGIRYFDNVNAWPKGRYLFEEFPATRNSLALPTDWNQMTHFRQFQIRPGTTIFEGPAARQGFYPGGQIQKYIADLDNLIAP